MEEAVCCPEFDPVPWDDKIIEWKDKRFVKGRVRTLFYIPVHFGGVMRELMKKIEGAGAANPDHLALSDHVSPWKMDVHVAVDREIPGGENTTISGRFFSKVYEGPFKNAGAWPNDFKAAAAGKKLTLGNWYMWYTTCPKCAKKYGKNYVVLLGKVE